MPVSWFNFSQETPTLCSLMLMPKPTSHKFLISTKSAILISEAMYHITLMTIFNLAYKSVDSLHNTTKILVIIGWNTLDFSLLMINIWLCIKYLEISWLQSLVPTLFHPYLYLLHLKSRLINQNYEAKFTT